MPAKPTRTWSLLSSLVLTASLAAVAGAQDDSDASGADPQPTPEAAHQQGLRPIPDFGGDLSERAYISGDWNGARDALATDAGVQIDVAWTQFVQGVADGGLDSNTEYGGTVDTHITFDLMRNGLMPGALIDIRALSRYGNFISTESAQVLPVNSNAVIPLTDPVYDDIGIAITNLTYMQFFSEQFGAFVGKVDTYNGDQNEFATGRGATQFMNYNFNFAASTAIVPASTLGAGIVLLPNENWMITSSVLNSTDTSTIVGFDKLDGGISATEARFQYRLGDLPGGLNAVFIYFFNTDFLTFDGNLSFSPGVGLAPATSDDSWMTVLSGWQYLFTEETPAEGPLDLANGRPDLQGVGLFGRIAFADEETNPWKFTCSVGVGGRGVIPNRDDDVFGVGYYYAEVDPDRFVGAVDAQLDDSEQGIEAFYNMAITPATHLTFDLQWLDTPFTGVDDALVLAGRLKIDF